MSLWKEWIQKCRLKHYVVVYTNIFSKCIPKFIISKINTLHFIVLYLKIPVFKFICEFFKCYFLVFIINQIIIRYIIEAKIYRAVIYILISSYTLDIMPILAFMNLLLNYLLFLMYLITLFSAKWTLLYAS
jgi:hypothetical protein